MQLTRSKEDIKQNELYNRNQAVLPVSTVKMCEISSEFGRDTCLDQNIAENS